LQDLADRLQERLTQLGRASWLTSEMESWQTRLEEFEQGEQWHRVSGSANLRPRSLAIVRALWRWRRGEAEQRNQPAKRILRDDLIVELARQQTADLQRIRAVRGMNFRGAQKHQQAIAQSIQQALDIPDSECPKRPSRRSSRSHLTLLTQFLSTALGSICRQSQVAPSLVGTSQDIQDLVKFHLDSKRASAELPALATGWRAEIVGQAINDLLTGKYALRIKDPHSDHPLVLETTSGNTSTS
jgi:ribonuclease D